MSSNFKRIKLKKTSDYNYDQNIIFTPKSGLFREIAYKNYFGEL